MTTKHTPGPWVRDTGSGFGCDVRDENGRKVAATWGINNGDPHRPAYRAECDANAWLIAAAPEQHAALIEAASAIEDAYEDVYQSLPDGPVPDWFVRLEAAAKQARATINKARGAQ